MSEEICDVLRQKIHVKLQNPQGKNVAVVLEKSMLARHTRNCLIGRRDCRAVELHCAHVNATDDQPIKISVEATI